MDRIVASVGWVYSSTRRKGQLGAGVLVGSEVGVGGSGAGVLVDVGVRVGRGVLVLVGVAVTVGGGVKVGVGVTVGVGVATEVEVKVGRTVLSAATVGSTVRTKSLSKGEARVQAEDSTKPTNRPLSKGLLSL
jgi:hypothetical protein